MRVIVFSNLIFVKNSRFYSNWKRLLLIFYSQGSEPTHRKLYQISKGSYKFYGFLVEQRSVFYDYILRMTVADLYILQLVGFFIFSFLDTVGGGGFSLGRAGFLVEQHILRSHISLILDISLERTKRFSKLK